MSNGFLKWLRSHDELGKSFNFSYKGAGSFGTVLGGFFSFLLKNFLRLILLFNWFSWAYEKSYFETGLPGFLGKNAAAYQISTSEFLPTFMLESRLNIETDYHDLKYWDSRWV